MNAPITLINVFSCDPANQPALLDLLQENTDTIITTLDGWQSTSLVAAQDGARVVIVSQWRNTAAVAAMRSDERMKAYFPKIAVLATLDSTTGTIAHMRQADET